MYGRLQLKAGLATRALAALAALSACGTPFTPREGAGGTSSGAESNGNGGAGSTSGPGQGPGPGPGGGGAPGCPGGGDACAECLLAACPDYACACWSNPECGEIFSCYNTTCPGGIDNNCASYCLGKHKSGISQSQLLGHCATASCKTQCGAVSDDGFNECDECLYTKCDKQMNACLGDPVCFDFVSCANNCGPAAPTCVNDCAAMYPSTGYADVQACAVTSCSGPCPG